MIANEELMNSKSIYTIFWPFRIHEKNPGKTKGDTLAPMKKMIAESGCWISSQNQNKQKHLCFRDYAYLMDNEEDAFMLYQYLNKGARDIFLNHDDSTCTLYRFQPERLAGANYYVRSNENKIYTLPIDTIELHVYNMNVGILLIQMHNNRYQDLNDIKRIGDSIRRIKNPLLSGEYICPMQIGISFAQEAKQKFGMQDDIVDLTVHRDENNQAIVTTDMVNGAGFLYRLLDGTVGKRTTIENTYVEIRDLSEDRLFEMAMIRDDAISKKIAAHNEEESWLQQLYSLVYVDANYAACQSNVMREELFAESLYRRWENYGSLLGITEFSAVYLTSTDSVNNEVVVRPFWCEYSYLISLVLAQRVGISVFSDRAGELTELTDTMKKLSKKQANHLLKLHIQYTAFKNQILLLEASPQHQGIEVYRMLQKQFFIDYEREVLDEQLQSLYEVSTMSKESLENGLGITIAVVALIVDVVINVVSILGSFTNPYSLFISGLGLLIVAIYLILTIYSNHSTDFKKR